MRHSPSLSSLRLFMQIAHTGSFSETARLTSLSQPALSRTIKLLEEELGVRLFDRNLRNVTLTVAGAALLPTIERLTGEFDMAFHELRQTFSGHRGRVVVGALPSVAAHVLPTIIADFHATHPRIDIVVRDCPSGVLHQKMLTRAIDFAVTTPPPATDGCRFDPLFDDDYVLICHRDDAGAIVDPAPWSAFAARPFVAMEQGSGVRTITDAAFAAAGLSIRPLYECGRIATVGGMIAAGLGMTLLPRSAVPLLGEGHTTVWRAMAPPGVSRTIGISRIENRTQSPAANAIMATITAAIRADRGA